MSLISLRRHDSAMTDRALDYIKHVLEQRDWSASRLADEAGLSPSTLNRPLAQPDWPHQISRRTIEKVFVASGVDPSPFGLSGYSKSAASGLHSPPQETVAGRILREKVAGAEVKQGAHPIEPDLKIGIHGRFVQIVATVDKAGLAELRRKLDAIETILDE